MATKIETQINELKINYLTEAQYEEALVNNQISDDEIYMTPVEEIETEEVTLSSLGVTATAAELNKLDGVTATTTEINYLDGVESNIQAQLDNKASASHSHSNYASSTHTHDEYASTSHTHDYAETDHTHSEYMTSTDPVGTGSFSLNRKADSTIKNYTVAMGYDAVASAQYAVAIGCNAQATATGAVALGYNTTASSAYSTAEGYWTKAEGTGSHAEGAYSTARGYQHVQGHYNTSQNAGSNSGTTGTAFIIGNGTSSTASNAFRVTYAGAAYGLSAYNSSGADMAEFREWLDGNLNNEDRRGYFVTMDGMNIKIAEPGDYICGVISANPCLVGNGDEDWQGRYLLDEFGSYIYEEKEEIDPATGETFINKFYKVNPDYNPTQIYVQREDRPEWDYVGLCGVINTRDDGTCEVNGFCKCGDGGIATKANRGYRVLERVNDNVIKILFFLTGEVF